MPGFGVFEIRGGTGERVRQESQVREETMICRLAGDFRHQALLRVMMMLQRSVEPLVGVSKI
jgi:hypothetical protein